MSMIKLNTYVSIRSLLRNVLKVVVEGWRDMIYREKKKKMFKME